MDGTMRSFFHPPFAAHRRPGTVGRPGGDRSVAEGLLGAGHPLVGALRRSETGFEQLVWVTAVQAAGVVFLFGGHGFGLFLAIAGVVVEVALACRLAALRARRRELCLELIIGGRQGLPFACLERESRRLLEPRTVERLATSVDEIVRIAARPLPVHPANRPLFNVCVIRRVAPELRQIAALLRGAAPCVRGVAAVEWLLTSSATPLYGPEVEPLRQELGRARYLLGLRP
jgi:hypothetical protein